MIKLFKKLETRTNSILGKVPVVCIFITMGFSSHAMASSENDCVIQISQPLINYGQVNRTQLFQGGVPVRDALLGKNTISLSAVCDSKSNMALYFRGEAASSDSYRFARTGAFTLKILSAQLDGKSVRLRPTQATASNSNEQKLRPGESVAPYDGMHTLAGERLSVLIEVETRIDAEAARVRTEEVWSGSGQFDVETY
ncbi:hypothetical protein [Pseudomonas chlororaphis]|uniref:hypothetical protein n=1 Tax=Pseudomonas chlororaphis TaxID=587753 RepID=UPI0019288A61|nr:hypothetical protein [Pseudomonas chlororaphis]QQX56985.1 hypothetical protein JHW28_20595 [Pseudomonas chlororaphis subsp. aurantiaca]UVE43840.1 hypothetical protein KS461_20875 [Pseudomonas chlororaphis]